MFRLFPDPDGQLAERGYRSQIHHLRGRLWLAVRCSYRISPGLAMQDHEQVRWEKKNDRRSPQPERTIGAFLQTEKLVWDRLHAEVESCAASMAGSPTH